MLIHGLRIPRRLSNLIRNNLWQPPSDLTAFGKITQFEYLVHLSFYGFESMERETTALRELARSEHKEIYGVMSSILLGKPVTETEIIDSDLAILIAGNYDEEFLFLDYRNKFEPRVLATSHKMNDSKTRHIEIASTFDDFADEIGLPQ
jgi:hypothetical protein